MRLINFIRLSLIGNRFASRRADIATIKAAIGLLMILVAVGILEEVNYRTDVAIEQEQAAKTEAMLLGCLNGTARFLSEDQHTAVVCEKAWSVKL